MNNLLVNILEAKEKTNRCWLIKFSLSDKEALKLKRKIFFSFSEYRDD